MSDLKKHVEDLHNQSELLSLDLDGLNDEVERKKKRLDKLKKSLREQQHESNKLHQEKVMLQNKLEILEPKVNEKLEMVEELESEDILNQEEMSTVMKESLEDLEQQAISLQKEVDEKQKELDSLKAHK